MKMTNNHNLPDIVLRAIENSGKAYSKGKARLSVTQLISPPQIAVLKSRHFKDMEQDAADQFWSLLGSAVHHILESGATGETVEERLFAEVNGWTISGAIDLQEQDGANIIVTDYKVTSAVKIMKGDFLDWERQQNIYAWLIHKNKGVVPTQIRICAIVRDWSRASAVKERNYPSAPMTLIYLPLWPLEKTEEYVTKRVKAHQEASLAADLDMDLPDCTEEEQWAQKEAWALMKPGQKRAIKLYDTEEEAQVNARSNQYIERRSGRRVRCEGNFCGVNKWCKQYAREQAADRERKNARDVVADLSNMPESQEQDAIFSGL